MSLRGLLKDAVKPALQLSQASRAVEIKTLVCVDHEGSPSSVLVPQVVLDLILDWKSQKKSALECRLGTAEGYF